MDLKTYLRQMTTQQRQAFAEKVGTTRGHLQNIAYGFRSCSPALAVAIERATAREITRRDLLPDEWEGIWPELANA